jgi:ADP-ribose pyrophosphatase YjhB (NUDIX family)
MPLEPRIRVSAVLRWEGRVLLCRHEKSGRVEALRRELEEEVAIGEDLTFEGPVAVVDSIAPKRAFIAKHVVHIIFAADLSGRSLERVTSTDAAVRGHRLFDPAELDGIVLHPPLQRFLGRWQPGDPAVYLGALWAP